MEQTGGFVKMQKIIIPIILTFFGLENLNVILLFRERLFKKLHHIFLKFL